MELWPIIFLVAAGQGVFLAIFLWLSQGRFQYANKILAVFILLFSLNTLENDAFWTGFRLEYPHIAGTTRGFVFLFGALLWWYANGITLEGWRISRREILHLVPFFIYTAALVPFYILGTSEKLDVLTAGYPRNPLFVWVVQVATCVHLGAYSIILLRRNQARIEGTAAPFSGKTIGIGLLIYAITFALYYTLIRTIDFKPEYDYVLSLIGIIAIYQVGYLAVVKPELLHGFRRKEISGKKYEKSVLTEEEANLYREQIQELLDKEKIYLHADLRLSDLATRLSISNNHVSQVINEHFGKTFNELLTEYRIQEAIRRLDDPDNDEKLLSIALNSGFNNRTSFNQAFKKHTGHSPKEYKEKTRVRV